MQKISFGDFKNFIASNVFLEFLSANYDKAGNIIG